MQQRDESGTGHKLQKYKGRRSHLQGRMWPAGHRVTRDSGDRPSQSCLFKCHHQIRSVRLHATDWSNSCCINHRPSTPSLGLMHQESKNLEKQLHLTRHIQASPSPRQYSLTNTSDIHEGLLEVLQVIRGWLQCTGKVQSQTISPWEHEHSKGLVFVEGLGLSPRRCPVIIIISE